MNDQLTGLTWPRNKAGVHNISKFRLRLIELLLGEGADTAVETMVASAQDAEAVRQDLLYIHTSHRPVTSGERELTYRLLRIGHSYGFRYMSASRGGLGQRSFMCKRGKYQFYLGVDLKGWPKKIGLELIDCSYVNPPEGGLRLSSEVDQPEAVAARFVELCEIALQHPH